MQQFWTAELDYPREYSGCQLKIENNQWILQADATDYNGDGDWEGHNNLVCSYTFRIFSVLKVSCLKN
jgi:hypothetical protein